MHYLIKMCSLCLCHNKELTKIDKVQVKYVNFLKKVLLQPYDATKIKLEEEFLCQMCIDKLESCFGLSELCMKNKIYSTFCCLCLNSDRTKLMNLRKISPHCASFYCKLIKSVRPQIFTCEKCLEKLNFYLEFQQNCIKFDKTLTGYLEQLTNFSTEIKIFKNSDHNELLDQIKNLLDEKPEPEPEPEPEKIEPTTEAKKPHVVDTTIIKQEVEIDIEENYIYENEEHHSEPEEDELPPEKDDEQIDHPTEVPKNPSFDFENNSGGYNAPTFDFEHNLYPEEGTSNFQDFGSHFLDSTQNDMDVSENNFDAEDRGSDESNFECPYCPDGQNMGSSKYHKSFHIDRKKKKCSICCKRFESLSGLYKHLDIKHFRKKTWPKYLQKSYNQNISILKIEKKGLLGEHFVCQFCPDSSTEEIKNFRTHKFKHLDREKNQCLICFKKLKYFKNLVAHLKNHYKSESSQNEEYEVLDHEAATSNSSNFENIGTEHSNNQEPPPTHFLEQTPTIKVEEPSHFLEPHPSSPAHFLEPQQTMETEGSAHFLEPPLHPKVEVEDPAHFLEQHQSSPAHFLEPHPTSPAHFLEKRPNQAIAKPIKVSEPEIGEKKTELNFKFSKYGQFICKFCPEQRKIDNYQVHKYEHIDRAKIQCLICFKKLKYLKNLVTHVGDHFKGKIKNNFALHYGGEILKQRLTQHLPSTTNVTNSVSCPFCPGQKIASLKEHKFVHINFQKSLCLICGRKFAAYKYLYKHIMGHFTPKYFDSATPNFIQPPPTAQEKGTHFMDFGNNFEAPPQPILASFEQNLEVEPEFLTTNFLPPSPEVTLGTDEQNLVPEITLTSPDEILEQSLLEKQTEGGFSCQFCQGQHFDSIVDHKFTHMDKKRLMCLICGAKFAGYRYLYRHVMKHFILQNMPKKLQNIIKSPPKQDSLRPSNNMVIQNNENGPPICKTFNCRFCRKTVNETFYKHFYDHMDVNAKKCLVCPKYFEQTKILYKHLKNHFKYAKIKHFTILNPTESGILKNCPFCTETINVSLPIHRLIHADQVNKICLICKKKFGEYEDVTLLSHVAFHFRRFYINTPLNIINRNLIHNTSTNDSEINESLDASSENLEEKETALEPQITYLEPKPKIELKKKVEKEVDVDFEPKVVVPKSYCKVCRVRVNRKGFKKHKNTRMHQDNMKLKKNNPQMFAQMYSPLAKKFCKICNIEILSKSFAKHTLSKVHLDNAQARLAPPKPPEEEEECFPEFANTLENDLLVPDTIIEGSGKSEKQFCKVCRVFVSRTNFARHRNSKMHLDTIRSRMGMGHLVQNSSTPQISMDEDAPSVTLRRIKVDADESHDLQPEDVTFTSMDVKVENFEETDEAFEEEKSGEFYESEAEMETEVSENDLSKFCSVELVDNEGENAPENDTKETKLSYLEPERWPLKFFCKVCNVEVLRKSFAKHKTSKMHLENLQNEKLNLKKAHGKYKCPYCHRHFERQTSFSRHVSGDCKFVVPKFHCEICKFKFRRRYYLAHHMQKIHGVVLQND